MFAVLPLEYVLFDDDLMKTTADAATTDAALTGHGLSYIEVCRCSIEQLGCRAKAFVRVVPETFPPPQQDRADGLLISTSSNDNRIFQPLRQSLP
ncbi:hypothetical protein VFPBJ_07392 [Purpureocillium lilacinum]|uniref:Uncharacterized protein n=1 Tax=Purpureocillium lilacinum TaxID=33203 RepID=A0A179GPN9_PURLI|nr:hypothetical protein VFPBJ_07392 [Purpureocillium lilacinum]